MKKIVLGCIAVLMLLITGCDGEQKDTRQDSSEVIRTVIRQGVNVWCDKETNTEYLIFKGYKSGGMTVRYNTNGTPKQCIIYNKEGI